MNIVNEFFNNDVDEKRKPRDENSFVSPCVYFQYKKSYFYQRFRKQTNYKCATYVLPLPLYLVSQDGEDVASGFIEGIKKMG